MSSVPMAASGQPGPITLVEITRPVQATTSTTLPPPTGITPPAPPRATNPGESMAWAYAATPPVPVSWSVPQNTYSSIGGVSATVTGDRATGFIELIGGESLGPDTVEAAWTNFQMPSEIPPGSTITAVIPVVRISSQNRGGFMEIDAGAASFGPGFSAGTLYGADIHTVAGKLIHTEIGNSVPGGAPPTLYMTFDFVGMAVFYLPAAVQSVPDGFFFSEQDCKWPSIITGNLERFLPWLDAPVTLQLPGSVATSTAKVSIQNISGNTVERDAAKMFTENGLIGQLCIIRIWRGDAEKSLLTFMGNVKDVDLQESSLVIDIDGFDNWSAITAPSYDIDTACPLTFASKACGSTSATPCDQTFGTCSQVNRFAGVLAQWLVELPDVQIAQPVPLNNYNNRRAF